jgi:quinol monooxygenase YgiN
MELSIAPRGKRGPRIEENKVMIALYSRWQLKKGCPPELEAALEGVVAEVEAREPGTLMFSVGFPAPNPPIGPPPEYSVYPDVHEARPDDAQTELVFFEIYRDAEAFSAHLRGPFADFLEKNRNFFATPWQGHPRPQTTFLEPRSAFVRAALNESGNRKLGQ